MWLGLVVVLAQVCGAYSVLTHEQVVDFLWKDDIQPLLQKRFPAATDDDLKKAHAYAYGGSLVQDMGYYPFGNKYFSDLTHYVRSGDFILNLISEAQNLNEFALALGRWLTIHRTTRGIRRSIRSWRFNFPNCRRNSGTR